MTGVDESSLKNARILIVDDQPPNVLLLERLLGVSGFTSVTSTTDSSQALQLCMELDPDLLLLDLQMPPPDGFEVMDSLAPWLQGPARLPILVLTADGTAETKRRALSVGASDFLSKPLDTTEVVLRVQNLLTTRLLQVELRDQNQVLEQRVRERTRELEEARTEIAERLALAAEYRDDMTGDHQERVGVLAARIATELGLPEDEVELLGRAAILHDVGKVAISDSILLKRGSLDSHEMEAMKLHVAFGSEILGSSHSALLRLAEEIARSHHERWDGRGYPVGLRGEEIPLPGRIVCVADAFEAMTGKRVYREPTSPEEALAEVRRCAGSQFDPKVVAALESIGAEELRSGTHEAVAA